MSAVIIVGLDDDCCVVVVNHIGICSRGGCWLLEEAKMDALWGVAGLFRFRFLILSLV